MPKSSIKTEIQELWNLTRGDSQICVAVLDGLVDQSHDCFNGANLTRLPTLIQGEATANGSMSGHGTHVASIIFGQHNSSELQGIAPQCRGLIVPIFGDNNRKLSQLDLARAIEQAVNAGAHIINVSAGQLTDNGEAEGWLDKAVQLCKDHNVLIVAAAGNDGCDCLHVPASLPTVLAVGAMNDQGKPIDFSNWGESYQNQGILAPGENILGAKPGGGTQKLSGTSFATPIVSGVAALLLSLQVQRGETPDPAQVRRVLLETAIPCTTKDTDDISRCLLGKLNISGALAYFTGGTMSEELDTVETVDSVEAAGCGCAEITNSAEPETNSEEFIPPEFFPVVPAVTTSAPFTNSSNSQSTTMSNRTSNYITASQAPSDLAQVNLVYALGTLGYDFGSEARRDSFKQLMPGVQIDGTAIPANPYDARQMVDYLGDNLSETKSLIWTLNLELTPIYAIEPGGAFARDVYEILQQLLSGQIQAEDSENYVERVSIPGILSGRSVKLFSGQVVPVIEVPNTRGLYGWKVNTLVQAAIETVQAQATEAQEESIRRTLGSFLSRIYYDLRNLGTTSQDRALNFASTNAFQAASTFAEAVATGMELDSITVEKSPFCRLDSDCWDVKLKFFDPENSRRAKKLFRFTIDVSDIIPVTLGEVRSWSTPY
ncbi:PatA/PatG family cyanobactin maturation protease [Dolichospermum circinale CS-1225]|uniref:PatA/PatG family cyanobactin maturation protease n=1 Tax=Dolichospermum circinale CS-537/01 TaxID=3021739 RepID=A0ABT5A3J3_9CYAN|nr:PatA/PatG family cyanobactin maturation protease [Dolichospermum circinale]MDB9486090.1 PatA/PatG family cyanobactin maturation protease [Dolichospermum circinale CS-537/01]MDB9523137.1 PatA/PatG family cyanobactin maturation protease [Dolichospermum circinale CS-1225]